jgi:hypothetical protein
MALWYCQGCTAAYSPGDPACPQCDSTDVNDEEAPMAKITETGVSHTVGEEPEGWETPLPGPDDVEPTDDIEVSADTDDEPSKAIRSDQPVVITPAGARGGTSDSDTDGADKSSKGKGTA